MISTDNIKDIMGFYLEHPVDGWAPLAALAKKQTEIHAPIEDVHYPIWFGARVAECENSPWPGIDMSLATAYGFGAVFDATLDYISKITSITGIAPFFLHSALPDIQTQADILEKITDQMEKKGDIVPHPSSVLMALSREEFCPTILCDYYEGIEYAEFTPIPPKYLRRALFPMPKA